MSTFKSLVIPLFCFRKLIVSTGVGTPNIPEGVPGIEFADGYEDISTNPDDFEGQAVLILGTLSL